MDGFVRCHMRRAPRTAVFAALDFHIKCWRLHPTVDELGRLLVPTAGRSDVQCGFGGARY